MADTVPALSGTPRWVTSHASGLPVAFSTQSGVVADRTRVFAVGRVNGAHSVVAIGAGDGAVWWAAPIPAPFVDSWSTPALDAGRNTVLVGAGQSLRAFDGSTGALRWQALLARNVVNASPLVVTDLPGGGDRAFITDYDGFGGAASLYCINLDAESASNPHQPGDIVWSVPIGGSSGNSPACADGVVFVSCITDESSLSPGRILAFPAAANTPPPPLWTFTNPVSLGFFGGVAVSNGAVFAASYGISGGLLNSNLVKVDAATGALRWSTPCNRTDATPIPLDGGRILLSAGIRGFGSAPSLELFQDHGASATMLWDSALATWTDLNNNTFLDPGEFLAVGSWTFQPIVTGPAGAQRVLAATPPPAGGSFAYYTDLYLLDLARAPTDPGFILDHLTGPGATPAAAYGSIYSVGAAGVYALGPADCYANCDQSTTAPALNVADFTCYLARYASAEAYANCDGSTVAPVLNVADFTCFLTRFAGDCP